MEHWKTHHIRGSLTIIAKKSALLFLLIFLINCETMKENKFKIIGNKAIIDNSKICVIKTSEHGEQSIRSLVYLNTQQVVTVNNDLAEYYNIYVSYNDKEVAILNFENIIRNISKDDITLILEKDKDGNVGIKNSYAKNLTLLIPFEAYLKQEGITDPDIITKQRSYFFNKY